MMILQLIATWKQFNLCVRLAVMMFVIVVCGIATLRDELICHAAIACFADMLNSPAKTAELVVVEGLYGETGTISANWVSKDEC